MLYSRTPPCWVHTLTHKQEKKLKVEESQDSGNWWKNITHNKLICWVEHRSGLQIILEYKRYVFKREFWHFLMKLRHFHSFEESYYFPVIIFSVKKTKWLERWITTVGVAGSKPWGGWKIDLPFHPSLVDQMNTTNSKGLDC